MRALGIVRTISAFGIAAACVFALSSCSSPQEEATDTPIEGLTGGVAATVNGVEIEEDTITTSIQNWRTTNSKMDEETWGQWLVDNDYTPETFREVYVDSYVNQELIRQAASQNNIEIQSSEIDEYVDKMKSYYNSDDEWNEALASIGYTEQSYREAIELALLEQKLQDTVVVAEEPTDEEILESAQSYVSYYDGAKKSSHILFNTEDEATAQEVLDKINSGELDFAEAAKEYSTDTASASDGGNVGWDVLNSFVTEYTDALETLGEGDISGLVPSDYGVHIIKVTELFTAPETLAELSQLPEEFVDSIRTSLESTKASEAWTTWWTEFEESAEVDTNEMPENVPYNIDLSGFTKTETEEATGDDLIDDTSDGSGDSNDDSAGDDADTANTDEPTGEGTEAEGDQPAEAA